MNENLKGMWRYAISKKLRKRIQKVKVIKLCYRIDKEFTEDKKEILVCGTNSLKDDCPFYFKHYSGLKLCLAPQVDKYWHETLNEQGCEVVQRYKEKYTVIGCYLEIFCEKGYENYNRINAWIRRVAKS